MRTGSYWGNGANAAKPLTSGPGRAMTGRQDLNSSRSPGRNPVKPSEISTKAQVAEGKQAWFRQKGLLLDITMASITPTKRDRSPSNVGKVSPSLYSHRKSNPQVIPETTEERQRRIEEKIMMECSALKYKSFLDTV